MMSHNLPCYYFPSKTLLLDDSQNFLESLEFVLLENLHYKTFSSPHNLINFVSNKDNPKITMSRCFQDAEEVSLTEASIALDIRQLYKEIFNPKRFEVVSVLVSDYAMPGMNGAEVCQQLSKYPLRKILLTGEVGADVAVKAFNEGIIDQFLLKDSPDFSDILNEAIAINQQQFFQRQSHDIINTVRKTTNNVLACLEDNAFINLVSNIIKKHNIVEYYLMDTQGSFLMLDKDARPYWLAVKNDTEIGDLINFAKFEEAPKETIKQLQARSHIPFFFTDEDLQTPPAEWQRFMHKATKLACDTGPYYYALITDPNAYELDRSKILSYADFLAAHE